MIGHSRKRISTLVFTMAQESMEVTSESDCEIFSEDSEDEYNLQVTVAVTENEGDEIEEEFTDALSEIHGEKSFPCSECGKVCKSKGGLTRHINSKHSDTPSNTTSPESAMFCFDTIASIVESIKSQIMREKLYGSAMNDLVNTASCTQAFFDALFPLYADFCRKKNQDKLVESLFSLMSQSCELLKCESYKAANLIMIHVPDHIVGFYNINRARATAQSTEISQTGIKPIHQTERGALSYVAGYVVSKLFQTNKRKSGAHNEEFNLLQSMKSDEASSFISSGSRGGLVNPSSNLVGILEEAEHAFREHLDQSKRTLRNIPNDLICNSTLKSPLVKSLWGNIVLSAGVDEAGSTQKLCLENVIKLYLKVRSFSYARDYLTQLKIKEKKVKKKSLRKDMKRSAELTI